VQAQEQEPEQERGRELERELDQGRELDQETHDVDAVAAHDANRVAQQPSQPE
jgi:hypothetical protein